MTENSIQVDIIKIFNTIIRSWKFILGFILISLIIGIIFYFVSTPKYETSTAFILRDPLETERNQMLSQDFFQNKRFFADEDYVDEVMAMSKTDGIVHKIIEHFDLVNKKGKNAFSIVKENLEFKRNDSREISISYADEDKELSAAITNYTRDILQEKYEYYFKSLNKNIISHLTDQITHLESNIVSINQSIDSLRNAYSLVDQLLPYRGESVATDRSAGSLEKAKGMEILVGYTLTKDKLNEEMAGMKSLIHEYSIGLKEDANLGTFNVIQEAHPDTVRKLPNLKLLLGGIAIAAIIISCIIVLVRRRSEYISQ